MGAPLLMSSSMRGGRGSPHCGGNMIGGVSAVPRMQVPSPAWRSGLRIWPCHGCLGGNYSSDGTLYARGGQKRKKKC